jgi:hypothetical protein
MVGMRFLAIVAGLASSVLAAVDLAHHGRGLGLSEVCSSDMCALYSGSVACATDYCKGCSFCSCASYCTGALAGATTLIGDICTNTGLECGGCTFCTSQVETHTAKPGCANYCAPGLANQPDLKVSFCTDASLDCNKCDFCPAPTKSPTAPPTGPPTPTPTTFPTKFPTSFPTVSNGVSQSQPLSELGQGGSADSQENCADCAKTEAHASDSSSATPIIVGAAVLVVVVALAVVSRHKQSKRKSEKMEQFGGNSGSANDLTDSANSRYLV